MTDLVDIDFNSSAGLALLTALSDRHGQRLARAAKLPGRLFLLRSPWAPGLRLVGGQIEASQLPSSAPVQPSFSVAGSAEGLEDALAACIAEGVERLSQIERPGDVSVECSLAELDPPVIPVVGSLIDELVVKSQLPRRHADRLDAGTVPLCRAQSHAARRLVPAPTRCRPPRHSRCRNEHRLRGGTQRRCRRDPSAARTDRTRRRQPLVDRGPTAATTCS